VQARLAGAVAELLAPVKDPILRWAYGRRAADRLGLPFELLAPRLGKAPARTRREAPRAAPAAAAGRAPGRSMEEAALRSLLALLPGGATQGALPARALLPPAEVFWDDRCRGVYDVVRVLWAEGGEQPPSLPALRERLAHDGGNEGGASVDLVARLVIEGPDAPGELPGRAHPSCEETLRTSLDELYRRWRKQRLDQLSREIHEAQRAGDEPRLQSLVAEKDVLSREVHLGGGALSLAPNTAR
jgi:hypothetical protein